MPCFYDLNVLILWNYMPCVCYSDFVYARMQFSQELELYMTWTCFEIFKCLELLLLRMTCVCIVIDLIRVCLGPYLTNWWFICLLYIQFSKWTFEIYFKRILRKIGFDYFFSQKNYFKRYFEKILNNTCFHNSFRNGFFKKKEKLVRINIYKMSFVTM